MRKLTEIFRVNEAPAGNTGGSSVTRDPSVPASMGGNVKEPPKFPPNRVDKMSAPKKSKHGSNSGDNRPGLKISGDPKTMEALMTALQSVRARDEDIMDWVESCTFALRPAVQNQQFHVDLPKFEETPGLDSFNDDAGGSDEDY